MNHDLRFLVDTNFKDNTHCQMHSLRTCLNAPQPLLVCPKLRCLPTGVFGLMAGSSGLRCWRRAGAGSQEPVPAWQQLRASGLLPRLRPASRGEVRVAAAGNTPAAMAVRPGPGQAGRKGEEGTVTTPQRCVGGGAVCRGLLLQNSFIVGGVFRRKTQESWSWSVRSVFRALGAA